MAYQQRSKDELAELEGRCRKLSEFFETDLFRGLEVAEQVRMRVQAHCMDGYLKVLKERIEAF